MAQQVRICLPSRRPGFNPWVGKITWRRKWKPSPVFLPGESCGRRNLVGYSPRGHKESDTTEPLHLSPFSSVQFSHSVMSDSLQPHESQHSRPPCPSPTHRSTPGLPVHHQLLEFTQTHVHQGSDAIQPPHPLSSPSPPAPNSFLASESFPVSQLFA